VSERIELIQMRLVAKDGDRGSLHVKSTFDKTEKMEHRTDESISFTDDDLVIIKNCRESPCEITLETIRLPLPHRIVCRPSRSSAFTLVHKDVSEVRSAHTFRLGGGESLVCQSSQWKPNRLRGSYSGPM
jgi:hypothetical protein